MWLLGHLEVLLLLLLVVDWGDVTAYTQFEDTEADDDDDVDFDDNYDSEDVPATLATTPGTSYSRIRRFGEHSRGRTLSLDEIREVKGAIKELLAGRQLDHLTTLTTDIITDTQTESAYISTKDPAFTGLTKIDNIDPTKFYEDIIEELIDSAKRQGLILTEKNKRKIENYDTKPVKSPNVHPKRSSVMIPVRTKNVKEVDSNFENADQTSQSVKEALRTGDDGMDNDVKMDGSSKAVEWIDDRGGGDDPISSVDGVASGDNANTDGKFSTSMNTDKKGKFNNTEAGPDRMTTKPTTTNFMTTARTLTTSSRRKTRRRRTTTTPTTTITTTTPEPEFDIPALVEIIANLTYDFETNITQMFNKTLMKYNIPTCKTPPPSTTEYIIHDLVNATVVAKCFVCGLEDTGIPYNAHCADAFAGDFLPLVPVDPQARGHIAGFRKYCRYLDVNGFYENATQPRSIYGRFTGGCSVRWIDLSGVYTQRACRNTRQTMMGMHFASKRMAKLEMALKEVDNGCIISPMASLVPLSRGVSLYARFHACVCTGSWCNLTSTNKQWISFIAILTLLITAVT